MTRLVGIILCNEVLILLTAINFLGTFVTASSSDHRYRVGDHIPLYVNKVGPLRNPSETYGYYELPFCHPDPVVNKKEILGEVLNSDPLMNALYQLKFLENKFLNILCEKKLSRYEVAKFRDAVINDFYFQMYYDDLPLWGFVGKVEDQKLTLNGKWPKYYLFNHVQFEVIYNGNQVIEIHAFSDPNHAVDISEDVAVPVKFTYSVVWNGTSSQFKNRMDKYSRASFLPINKQIHRFAFINLVVIIVLLTGLFLMIYARHLKNDPRWHSGADEMEDSEVGWKHIHGDVFRCPQYLPLLCAMLGSGCQLLTMVGLLFLLAFVGVLYPYSHGSLSISLLVIYTVTSTVSGYRAASFYSQFAETGWGKHVFLSGIIYLGPVIFTIFILNSVAIAFGATSVLPLGTIVVIFLLYTLLAIPLHAFSASMGCQFGSKFEAPSAAKKCPREIPALSWYRKTPYQMFIGGFLPFSAIVVELRQLYASIWGFKICTVPIILFAFFIILIILIAILSSALTYFQLTSGDYQWWWRSFLCGGSTAIFMFGYGIYFYAKSDMTGFMQLSYFFGYTACFCYAFFLILGTVGFYASFMFVHHIYQAVKSE